MLHFFWVFLGGVFLTNAVPHFVNGVTGRAFQSPFAKPPGRGLSTSKANVSWGFANMVVGYIFTIRLGSVTLTQTGDAVALGLGIFLFGMYLAQYFGKFHGGSTAIPAVELQR